MGSVFTRKTAVTLFFTAALALTGCAQNTGAVSDPSPSASAPQTTSSPATSTTVTPTPTPTPSAEETTATPEAPSPEPTTAEPITAEPTSEAPAPEPTPEAKNLVIEGAITQRGISCGKVTEDKALIMAAAPEALSCEAAQEVMSQAITAGVQGETEIFGYQCRGRDEASALLDGRSITCTAGETRLEAMENYTLAGAPVTATADYPTQFGNIPVHGFTANGVDCYFGKVGGVSCWRPSVLNSLPYEVAALSPSTGFKIEAPQDLQDPAVVDTQMRELLPGEVITTNGMSCNNDGTYTSCRVGDHWFKINASELKNS